MRAFGCDGAWYEPTAWQSVAVAHDTALSVGAPRPVAMVCVDQLVPSHICAMTSPEFPEVVHCPSAQQLVVLPHDTRLASLFPVPPASMGTVAQLAPSHLSAS